MNPSQPQQNNEDEPFTRAVIKKKRDQFRVEIRKEKLREMLENRRFKADDEEDKDDEIAKNMTQEERTSYLRKAIDEFSLSFEKGNLEGCLDPIKSMRKLLANDESEGAILLNKSGILPELVRLLLLDGDKSFQVVYECSWLLINYTSSEGCDCSILISADLIHSILSLLGKADEKLQNHLFWLLANIAGDPKKAEIDDESRGLFACQLLTDSGIETLIEETFSKFKELPQENQEHFMFFCANLCQPKPPFDRIVTIFQNALELLPDLEGETLVEEALWIIYGTMNIEEQCIEEAMECEVLKIITPFLSSKNSQIRWVALRCITLISGSENEDHSWALLRNPEVIKQLFTILETESSRVLRESIVVFSNLLAGSREQIDFFVEKTPVLEKLEQVLERENDNPKTMAELIWCFRNMTCCSTPEQTQAFVVKYKLIEKYISFIQKYGNATEILDLCLEGLKNILADGEVLKSADEVRGVENPENPYLSYLDGCGGMKAIDDLQYHQSEAVYKKVYEMIETFCVTRPDDAGHRDRAH